MKGKMNALTILNTAATTIITGCAKVLNEGLFQHLTYRIMTQLPQVVQNEDSFCTSWNNDPNVDSEGNEDPLDTLTTYQQ